MNPRAPSGFVARKAERSSQSGAVAQHRIRLALRLQAETAGTSENASISAATAAKPACSASVPQNGDPPSQKATSKCSVARRVQLRPWRGSPPYVRSLADNPVSAALQSKQWSPRRRELAHNRPQPIHSLSKCCLEFLQPVTAPRACSYAAFNLPHRWVWCWSRHNVCHRCRPGLRIPAKSHR